MRSFCAQNQSRCSSGAWHAPMHLRPFVWTAQEDTRACSVLGLSSCMLCLYAMHALTQVGNTKLVPTQAQLAKSSGEWVPPRCLFSELLHQYSSSTLSAALCRPTGLASTPETEAEVQGESKLHDHTTEASSQFQGGLPRWALVGLNTSRAPSGRGI